LTDSLQAYLHCVDGVNHLFSEAADFVSVLQHVLLVRAVAVLIRKLCGMRLLLHFRARCFQLICHEVQLFSEGAHVSVRSASSWVLASRLLQSSAVVSVLCDVVVITMRCRTLR
jgi:hypothetical protein